MKLVKVIAKIAIKAALVIVGILGIVFTAQSSAFMGGASVFFFFTVQSNIFIILMALIFLINEVVQLFIKKSFINEWLLKSDILPPLKEVGASCAMIPTDQA